MSDNFYRSNKVSSQPITFQNQFKMTVAANLFIPKDLDTSVPAPAIVVGHRCEGAKRSPLRGEAKRKYPVVKEAVDRALEALPAADATTADE
ncbi:hypothetical protein PF010_g11317 [Phytophthora fragariae]|uniref:Uncharacterized protein n=1 Tax=Phytophthora fragariae TaxID=53985 RepID=A0A6A3Z4G8_9STRA|nr:hypothetical protein PF010_g11317 [Phytophthora fragariae]KAE9229185.1 hypothetical protein PF004_g10846 [Phytophthora fragariae]KAE9230304.1 hypothetical protein PF002_g13058 [Phytophthora fragariae]